MFISSLSFRGAASTMAEMQATAGAYDSQAGLINNSRAQEQLMRDANNKAAKALAERDKQLALERIQLQTKLKMEEAQKKALEEKRKKEAAKK